MFVGLACLSYVCRTVDFKSQDRCKRDVRSTHDKLACQTGRYGYKNRTGSLLLSRCSHVTRESFVGISYDFFNFKEIACDLEEVKMFAKSHDLIIVRSVVT